jgi:hypothetical protein
MFGLYPADAMAGCRCNPSASHQWNTKMLSGKGEERETREEGFPRGFLLIAIMALSAAWNGRESLWSVVDP